MLSMSDCYGRNSVGDATTFASRQRLRLTTSCSRIQAKYYQASVFNLFELIGEQLLYQILSSRSRHLFQLSKSHLTIFFACTWSGYYRIRVLPLAFNTQSIFHWRGKVDKMNGEAEQQKQDRHRTRWTASLDKIFADLVVAHIQQGDRSNDAFDKKTWNLIRNEFNSLTNSNFNNNQLRKHLDVLRIRYNNLKSAPGQHDNTMDDPCYVGFDLWEDIGAQSRPETSKMKECPIYEQLCTIFGGSGAEGRYAQSSHYKGLEKPRVTDLSCPESGNPCPETPSSSKHVQLDVARIFADRKRKRALEESSSGQGSESQEIGDAMAKAMMDMIASYRLITDATLQSNNYYTISNCVRALDEIGGVDDSLYYAALDLFEDANIREVFLSLRSNAKRMTWLQAMQGKCPTLSPPTHSLGELFALPQ